MDGWAWTVDPLDDEYVLVTTDTGLRWRVAVEPLRVREEEDVE